MSNTIKTPDALCREAFPDREDINSETTYAARNGFCEGYNQALDTLYLVKTMGRPEYHFEIMLEVGVVNSHEEFLAYVKKNYTDKGSTLRPDNGYGKDSLAFEVIGSTIDETIICEPIKKIL